MALKNANKLHYRAVVYCLAWLFDDYIGDDGRINWRSCKTTIIDRRLDEYGIDIDFSQIAPPIF